MRFTARQLKQCGEKNETDNFTKLTSRTQSLELYLKIEYVFVIKFNELFPIVGLLGLLLPFDNFE